MNLVSAAQNSGKHGLARKGHGEGGGSLSLKKGWRKKLKHLPTLILRSIQSFSTPLVVPAEQPIELYFFQRIFDNLCESQCMRHKTIDASTTMAFDDSEMEAKKHSNGTATSSADVEISAAPREVPVVQFHKAMVRLFRILKPGQQFDEPYQKVDANDDGKVGWYEFCSFWKEHNSLISVRLTIAERVFLTLEDAERSILGRIMSILVFLAILVSTGCFILGTVPEFQSKCILKGEPGFDPKCKPETDAFFQQMDLACVVFFSVEYGMRLLLSGIMRSELVDKDRHELLEWMVTDDNIRRATFLRRVSRWLLSPANLIDLAAIMPWYLTKIFENSGGSDSLIIRLIRLTRVIRAIRLGKKFEAVIIVARSVRRSLRALYVLVLNLVLGVIIFGALMYFCEQGEWDKEKKAHMRNVGPSWNPDKKVWEDTLDRSPFESIPACFWWAIVTASTVGYGDMYPTTPAGKVIAGISMAWSLCVLALPIGVIGNNFSTVWDAYDKEKAKEQWNAFKEDMMLKRSIAWGDPLHYSRRLLLEVWHDPGIKDADDQAEFMGEVDFAPVPMPAKEPASGKFTLPLTTNYDKARRRVRGMLTFEYTWTPASDKMGSDALLSGTLEVNVISGEELISIDWKGSCSSDPYVVVVAYPNSPGEDGRVHPVWHRTETEQDTSNPRWNQKVKFDIHWTEAGTASCMQADMRRIGDGVEHSPIVGAPSRSSNLAAGPTKAEKAKPSEQQKTDLVNVMVPEMREELRHLERTVVPQITADINDLRQDLELIISTLRRRGVPGASRPADSRLPPAKAQNSSASRSADAVSSFASADDEL